MGETDYVIDSLGLSCIVGWAGEPDGTQSGLSGVEMTVRRPTVVSRKGCENPRRHGTLREDCCLLKRRRGLGGIEENWRNCMIYGYWVK